MSKIVEKKNESKSQQVFKQRSSNMSCVKDRWEKEWKQITTFTNGFIGFMSCVKDRWEKEWKQITTNTKKMTTKT